MLQRLIASFQFFAIANASSDIQVDEEMILLRNHSLLKQGTIGDTVSINPRLRQWLRSIICNSPREQEERAKSACQAVELHLLSTDNMFNFRFPLEYSPAQDYFEEQLLPQIERCLQYVSIFSQNEFNWVALGDTCRRQGMHDLARRFYDAATSVPRPISLQSAILLDDLESRERVFGPNHLRTRQAAIALASGYQKEGEYDKAEIFWRRVALADCKTPGIHNPLTWQDSTDLGMVLQRQSKFQQAKLVYNAVYKVAVLDLGAEDINCLRIRGNLAILFTIEGKLEMAEEMYPAVIKGMEAQLGPEHPDTERMKKCFDSNQKQQYDKTDGGRRDAANFHQRQRKKASDLARFQAMFARLEREEG